MMMMMFWDEYNEREELMEERRRTKNGRTNERKREKQITKRIRIHTYKSDQKKSTTQQISAFFPSFASSRHFIKNDDSAERHNVKRSFSLLHWTTEPSKKKQNVRRIQSIRTFALQMPWLEMPKWRRYRKTKWSWFFFRSTGVCWANCTLRSIRQQSVNSKLYRASDSMMKWFGLDEKPN